MDELLAVVANNNMLCLNVDNPSWDNARGYLFDSERRTLYFPVDKKALKGRNFDRYELLVWSQPRVVIVGRLLPASEDDLEAMIRLASRTMDSAAVDYMLFDQRNHKLRKNRHKLIIDSVRLAENAGIRRPL
jgi:hypothetical protein